MENKDKKDLEYVRTLMTKVMNQDNRITQYPIYLVQSKEYKIIDEEYDSADRYAYVLEEDSETHFYDIKEAFDYLVESEKVSEDIDDEDKEDKVEEFFRVVPERAIWVDKGWFLTEEAAKKHIELNHYHYTAPRVYVDSFWRNYEMQELIQALCRITGVEIAQYWR